MRINAGSRGECPVGETRERNEDGSTTFTSVTLQDNVCSTSSVT